jgi:hypothetical protein
MAMSELAGHLKGGKLGVLLTTAPTHFLVPKFYLGTRLLRQFYCRSLPGLTVLLARNKISREQETFPSETWERGDGHV